MTDLLATVRADWIANKKSKKGKFILPLFRVSHWFAVKSRTSKNPLWKLAIIPRMFYLLLVVWILGVELHDEVTAGAGLAIFHGQALVVNGEVRLGQGCILRHSVTIGHVIYEDGTVSESPVLGDGVEVGANVVIIGPVKIGSHARIGAGAVVVRDIPEGAVAVGNPARIVRYRAGYEPRQSYATNERGAIG